MTTVAQTHAAVINFAEGRRREKESNFVPSSSSLSSSHSGIACNAPISP